jgi:hypothetical protein
MKRLLSIPALLVSFTLIVCAQTGNAHATTPEENVKMRITVGSAVLTATLDDNSTTRALVAKFPLTVLMQDLYSREMCYHFPDALPADNVQNTGYEVGEIIYWPPRHSLVIMYAQNGERFSMQKIGRIENGVAIFSNTGNVTVTFEVIIGSAKNQLTPWLEKQVSRGGNK